MSIKLVVKNQKPFTEVVVDAKGIKSSITVGIKVYSHSDIAKVRKEFKKVLTNAELELKTAELTKWEAEGDKTDPSFYVKREELQDAIEESAEEQAEALMAFYKKQITHIKNASLEYSKNGETVDLNVADSRKAIPVESLWEDPSECLTVLLDTYLNYLPFRDSLTSKVSSVVFNIDIKEQASLKN